MVSRRNFLRQGALWVAGAAIIEPPLKRLIFDMGANTWRRPQAYASFEDMGGGHYRVRMHNIESLSVGEHRVPVRVPADWFLADYDIPVMAHVSRDGREVTPAPWGIGIVKAPTREVAQVTRMHLPVVLPARDFTFTTKVGGFR